MNIWQKLVSRLNGTNILMGIVSIATLIYIMQKRNPNDQEN